MTQETRIRNILRVLILGSLLVRALVAGLIELGNDEVYYRLYALFPDWSHFDHPPMVGWVIQLFSLNLLLDHEFFIRLGAVLMGTLNTWIIYRIGREIKDELTGLYAALLYTGSIYCSVIAGTFILPDSPQLLFWLLSLWLLLKSLPDKDLQRSARRNLLLAGVTIGLALLSKYHSVFLITGAGLYILLFNRRWFRTKELYLSLLIALVLCLPVVIWNFQNDFISFTFHEERVEGAGGIRWDFLGTEVIGQFFYNNPVNGVLILLSFIALIRKGDFIGRQPAALLLSVSIPLSLVFLSFSFENRTLPHWTGPAYLSYMLIAAAWLSGRKENGKIKSLVPASLKVSVGLLAFVVVVAFLQIRFGVIPLYRVGLQDPTAQMTGWRQIGEKFSAIAEQAERSGEMPQNAPVVATRWFPSANFDFYAGAPYGRKVYAFGTLERIHKYDWINKERGEIPAGSNAWYIGFSDDLPVPGESIASTFDSIRCTDTIPLVRGGHLLREAYVYRLYHFQGFLSKEIW